MYKKNIFFQIILVLIVLLQSANFSVAAQSKQLDEIDLSQWPTLPSPWSSVDGGETWIWGDFFLIFQKQPKTVYQVFMKQSGQKPKPIYIVTHYAMSVFYRNRQSTKNKINFPIMTIALEQARLGEPAYTNEVHNQDKMGPLMVAVFVNELRGNLGLYEGTLTASDARKRFFEVVSDRLNVSGKPKKIGDMRQAFGSPETGLPALTKK